MEVIKRDGSRVPYDDSKIIKAISAANNSITTGKILPIQIEAISESVKLSLSEFQHTPTVEDVQELIENELINLRMTELAKCYIRYRYCKLIGKKGYDHSKLFNKMHSLLNFSNSLVNSDNANKSPTHHNVARDFIAGLTCKEDAEMIIPQDILDAHKSGMIHWHDMDFTPSMAMHNCFRRSTRFVTSDGIKSFDEFNDGDEVTILDKDGIPRLGTIHNYGKRKFNKITFTLRNGRLNQVIYATPDHRWYLVDGSVTTNLKVGDYLYSWKHNEFDPYNCTKDELDYWTFGFVLGDGSDYWRGDCGVQILLCGDKAKYEELFLKAGFIHKKSDWLYKYGTIKSEFIEYKWWKDLAPNLKIALFNGYFAADGCKSHKAISTVNPDLYELTKDLADFSSYYTIQSYDQERENNFGYIYEYVSQFSTFSVTDCYGWRVSSIESTSIEEDAWCIEEPITKSFMLEKGIVTGNCCLIDLNDMLNNGTEMNGTYIYRPHSLSTAVTIATQISMSVASHQYGGQTISLAHLAPYVNVSRNKIIKNKSWLRKYMGDENFDDFVESELRDEIRDAIQTLQYQEITCANSNGQSPFISIFMYLNEVDDDKTKDDLALLIEEVLRQRIKGIQSKDKSWVSPVFPKLIYVLEDDNINPGDKYYYLTELARDCTIARMVPDYVSEKVMKETRGECFSSMGCRSQLNIYYPKDHPECIVRSGTDDNHPGEILCIDGKWHDPNKAIFYTRFNQGVITINLPDVALTVLKEFSKSNDEIGTVDYMNSDEISSRFWDVLNERLELCHRSLRIKHERLIGTPSNTAPILWQGGALARLEDHEVIDPLLKNGWSTISLGYIGVYECVKALTGVSHTTDKGSKLAIDILTHLKSKCDEWSNSEPEHLGYSIYGTPSETLTDKFGRSLQRRFGTIKGITDKLYVTNSYHVPVFEEIDAFSKLSKESKFQVISSGGNVSYIELPAMNKNPEAVMEVIKYIYDHNIYAEINTKLDHCLVCKYDGEIKLDQTSLGKFKLVCPKCGNTDARKMYVVRRLCGYVGRIDSKDNPISSDPSALDGRLGDIHDRVCHL